MLFEYLAFCLFAALWLGARSMRGDVRVIHFHNPPDFLVFCGLPSRLRGTKLVLDIHDLTPHMFAVRVSGRAGQVGSAVLLWIERLACRLADQVVTVHQPYLAELARHGVPDEKIHVVMNSVDPVVIDRARITPPFGRDPHTFTVAYHGTLTWWYGTDLILEAIETLRRQGLDVDGVILGDGDAVPSLLARAQEPLLSGHVELSARYLPIEQALATAARAGCGVIPNRPTQINRFALSSKLFEYVELCVPVVVARLDTLAAHFAEDEVTFFEPGNPDDLARAIRWIYEHPDEARAKAERARRRAEAYSWSQGRQILTTLYNDLVPVE
jgi:glycosyltransferase involved in cell wall biosynthesis